MKILVTGGGGYIGSALSIELAKQGHDVTVIDKFVYGKHSYNRLIYWGVDVHPFRLVFSDKMKLINFDVVFHLAAIAGSKACDEAGKELVWDYNNKNTIRLVDSLLNELLIFTSTSAIYGESSSYTLSKIQAEQDILLYPNSIAIRLPTIFGLSPCMRENILVNDLVKSAVHEGYIVLWDKDTTRTWMPLEDCVSGLITLMENPYLHIGETENIDGNYWKKSHIAGFIKYYTNCEVFYSDRKGKYVQDFNEVPLPRFRYEQNICNTIKELVEYYEGTKHTSAIDWSK